MFFENDVHLCVFCVEFSVLNTLFIFNFDFITFFLLDLIKKKTITIDSNADDVKHDLIFHI